MDPIWSHLPRDLADHVCNQLPKVRAIPKNLKDEIVNQRWMLAKSYNWYLDLCMYHSRAALFMFKRDLGVEEGCDINEHWANMNPEDRILFYHHGPGSDTAKELLEREREFRDWRESIYD